MVYLPRRERTSTSDQTRFQWPRDLHCPTVFHSLMVLSRLPLTICRLSAEKATLRTSFLWLTNCRVLVPTDKSHRRKDPSHEPLTAKRPSLEMTTSETKCEWPRKALLGTPHEVFSLLGSYWLFNCQMIIDLSREAERTMSGNWGVVAICVTQSLCPTRAPLRTRCSLDMIVVFSGWKRNLENDQGLISVALSPANGFSGKADYSTEQINKLYLQLRCCTRPRVDDEQKKTKRKLWWSLDQWTLKVSEIHRVWVKSLFFQTETNSVGFHSNKLIQLSFVRTRQN